MQIQQAFDEAAYEAEAQLRELRRLVGDTVIFSDAQDAAFIELTEVLDKVKRKSALLRHSLLSGEDPIVDEKPEVVAAPPAPTLEIKEDPRTKWVKDSYHLPFDADLEKEFVGVEPFQFSRPEEPIVEGRPWITTRFYTATDEQGRGYFIMDDRANIKRLDNPDDRSMMEKLKDQLITVHEFETVAARDAYNDENGLLMIQLLRDAKKRQEEDEGGSSTIPAVVPGPTPVRSGGAMRTFDEAQEPPRNP